MSQISQIHQSNSNSMSQIHQSNSAQGPRPVVYLDDAGVQSPTTLSEFDEGCGTSCDDGNDNPQLLKWNSGRPTILKSALIPLIHSSRSWRHQTCRQMQPTSQPEWSVTLFLWRLAIHARISNHGPAHLFLASLNRRRRRHHHRTRLLEILMKKPRPMQMPQPSPQPIPREP